MHDPVHAFWDCPANVERPDSAGASTQAQRAEEHVAMNPRAYRPGDPPVAPMINLKELVNALRRISCRDTNGQVRDVVRSRSPQQSLARSPHSPFNGFEEGFRAAQMSFGMFAPERRYNSKRGARMLEDFDNDGDLGVFSGGRKPLMIKGR